MEKNRKWILNLKIAQGHIFFNCQKMRNQCLYIVIFVKLIFVQNVMHGNTKINHANNLHNGNYKMLWEIKV